MRIRTNAYPALEERFRGIALESFDDIAANSSTICAALHDEVVYDNDALTDQIVSAIAGLSPVQLAEYQATLDDIFWAISKKGLARILSSGSTREESRARFDLFVDILRDMR